MHDHLMPKSKFPWLLAFSAIFIALCAACFSVYGIATLFAGATISVIIMGSSLEIGKLVGVTFLYRYWSKTRAYLKGYLSIAVIMLMIITSLGIFGYLSAAYQKSSIEFSVTQEKIKTTSEQKVYYQDKIAASKKRIDDLSKLRSTQESRMNEVSTNEFLSRNPLQLKQVLQQNVDLITDTDKNIKEENSKIQTSIDDVRKLDEQVNQLKLGTADKKDVQTFKFVADALGLPLDTVARWFIIMIIFVFDPMAIGLILAYNVAVYRKEDDTVYDAPSPIKSTLEQPKEIVKDIELPKTNVVETKSEPQIEKVIEKPAQLSEWFRQMFKL
jgi:small-conductance mechanosensitive channel